MALRGRVLQLREAVEQLVKDTNEMPCDLVKSQQEVVWFRPMSAREKHDAHDPPCVPCNPPDMMVKYVLNLILLYVFMISTTLLSMKRKNMRYVLILIRIL